MLVDDWESVDFTVEGTQDSELAIRNIISLADSMLQVVFDSGLCCSSSSVIVNTIRTICSTAISLQSAIMLAESDAQDFVFPADIEQRDVIQLKCVGSLDALIQSHQLRRSQDRFNVDRCRTCFSEDPEFERLMELASHGAFIDVAPEFVRCPFPDASRPLLTKQLSRTIAKHAFKLWVKGDVIILPFSVLQQFPVHFNNLHWCPKPGAPGGRFLGDCSNRTTGSPLNSEGAKELIKARYGDLCHPTISDLVNMIWSVADSVPSGLEGILLWKEDVANAFGQFNQASASAPLLAFPISSTLALVYCVGMFGWTGSPFVFGVFSRAFRRQALRLIAGQVDVYVDDFMGVSPACTAKRDQELVQNLVVNAFGSSGINLEKSVAPRRLADFIGWTIDLDSATLRPNDKGVAKLVVEFFSVDAKKSYSLHKFQVLSSLAARYSQGLRGMRPFVHALFAQVSGFSRYPRSKRRPSSAAMLAIMMWRAVSIILLDNPTRIAVPLESFRPRSLWDVYIISDAGPLALGVAIYQRSDDGSPLLLKGFISYRLPYVAQGPEFQNAREFQGVLLGIITVIRLGLRHCRIQCRGDNISALSWIKHDCCKSLSSQTAFIAFSWLLIMSGCEVVDVQHQAGVTMGDIDGLSRFRDTQFDSGANLLPILGNIDPLFLLCDPRRAIRGGLSSHLSCLHSLMPLLVQILSRS